MLYNIVQGCVMNNNNPRKLILEVLRKHPEGLTILSIAKLSGLHRHTSTKYIHELMGAGIVFQRTVGPAKLCYLKEKIENKKDQEKVLKKLEKRRKGGQSKLVVFVILATFLLSETVIFAYQNVSLLNETNFSRISTINTSPLIASNNSNLSIVLNIPKLSNSSIENTNSIPNRTSSIFVNETVEESSDETVEFLNKTNETSREALEPIFDVSLDYSGKITRGETLSFIANVRNAGSLAKNVFVKWVLPKGFEVISGNSEDLCGDLDNDVSCDSEIGVKADLSTILGLNEIKIVVNYEK